MFVLALFDDTEDCRVNYRMNLLDGLSSIDDQPRRFLETLISLLDDPLETLILVSLLSILSSLAGLFDWHLHVNNQVRIWKSSIWILAPFQIQSLGGGKRNTRESISVHDESCAWMEFLLDDALGFPSVGREQEMDRLVFQILFGSQIGVQYLSNGCVSIWESHQLWRYALGMQRGNQFAGLSCFSTAINSLEDNKCTSHHHHCSVQRKCIG